MSVIFVIHFLFVISFFSNLSVQIEYERRIKEKDTEIEVIKEMLKSSKSMIRFRDGEIEKLKRLLSGESPKIELPNVHDRLYKSSKSNKSI